MPDGKTVILGLISTKYPSSSRRIRACPHPRGGALRADGAPRLSTQCGFSGNIGNTAMTIDQRYGKLSHVVGVAREAWPDA